MEEPEEAAVSDNAADFDAFYEARVRGLVTTIYLRTGDFARAQECVQEAFVRAWLRWGELRSGPEPSGWVRTVAWRLAVSDWRRSRIGRRVDRIIGATTTAVMQDPAPEVVAVRIALDGLADPYRAVIVLFYFEDMTVPEIAELLGQPEGTVKSNLHRARGRLKVLLDESGQRAQATGHGKV